MGTSHYGENNSDEEKKAIVVTVPATLAILGLAWSGEHSVGHLSITKILFLTNPLKLRSTTLS